MNTRQNDFAQIFYADELVKSAQYHRTTKFIFAGIFFILSVFTLVVSLLAELRHSGTQTYWFLFASLTVITGFFILYMPKDLSRLMIPSQIAAEINIADYYWLLKMCQEFPDIRDYAKKLLQKRNIISFNNLEEIWKMIANNRRAQLMSVEFFREHRYHRYADLHKVKEQLLTV